METTRFWKTRAFWEDFLERTVATFIAALLGFLPATTLDGGAIDWKTALTAAAFATLITALKGIVAALNDPASGASLGTTVPRDLVRSRTDESSPTDAVADEGSNLRPETPVKQEEPYTGEK